MWRQGMKSYSVDMPLQIPIYLFLFIYGIFFLGDITSEHDVF